MLAFIRLLSGATRNANQASIRKLKIDLIIHLISGLESASREVLDTSLVRVTERKTLFRPIIHLFPVPVVHVYTLLYKAATIIS